MEGVEGTEFNGVGEGEDGMSDEEGEKTGSPMKKETESPMKKETELTAKKNRLACEGRAQKQTDTEGKRRA